MPFNWKQLHADFKQKYEDTYVHVRFKPGSPKELFRIVAVSQSAGGLEPTLTLVNSEYGTVQLNYDTEAELMFDWPETGYSFHRKTMAVFFRRRSGKRYQRAPAVGNCEFAQPNGDYLRFPLHVNEELLKGAFNPQFFSWSRAFGMLDDGALSVPLSKHLALAHSPSASVAGPVLWFDNRPIATVSQERVTVREEPFRQEVVDFTRGLDVQVV